MDQIALVGDRVNDGQKLIQQLAAAGFDITAAFWVRSSEDGQWALYIASKTFDEKGPHASYLLIVDALHSSGADWISMSDVTLISPSDPISADVLAMLRGYAGRRAVRSQNRRLGKLEVEEVIIYPPRPLAWKDKAKVEANLQKFIDQGWKPTGLWDDGYPCVEWGKDGAFIIKIRVDEDMTPDKVPYLEGLPPKPFSGTNAAPQLQ
jgi:hypothetical protein